jgi:hypothetical protein
VVALGVGVGDGDGPAAGVLPLEVHAAVSAVAATTAAHPLDTYKFKHAGGDP